MVNKCEMNKMYMNESQPTYITGTKILIQNGINAAHFPFYNLGILLLGVIKGLFSSPGAERSLLRTQTYQHLLDSKICSPFLYTSEEIKIELRKNTSN